jgi:prepilin-type N-terminal cleavage/methylation domain-containing protein/prepilin-type processing-associated H-X9-DG protein
MLILKRWRCVRHSDSAFTLIELLVSIALLLLLLSILLPNLRKAREQGRAVVCAQRLHDFGIGLATYVNDNEDWLPGVNTSGVAVRTLDRLWPGDADVLSRSDLPVQAWDWMTPLLAGKTDLPAVRALRFKFLLEKMCCPSQMYYSGLYEEEGHSPDRRVFEANGPYRTVSYLMPAQFQFVGQDHKADTLAYKYGSDFPRPVRGRAPPDTFEYINYDYLPRIDRVGRPARKVFAADGTRYLECDGGTEGLDFDVYPYFDSAYPSRGLFGSFTDPAPWWCGSTAYGVEQGSLNWDNMPVDAGVYPRGRGRNLALSYRHGADPSSTTSSAQRNPGRVNAVLFDGHVERLDDRRSREIELWYPTGTRIQSPEEGMTRVPQDFQVP